MPNIELDPNAALTVITAKRICAGAGHPQVDERHLQAAVIDFAHSGFFESPWEIIPPDMTMAQIFKARRFAQLGRNISPETAKSLDLSDELFSQLYAIALSTRKPLTVTNLFTSTLR